MLLEDFSKNEELNEYIRSISGYPKLTLNEMQLLLNSSKLEDKQKFIYGYLYRVIHYAIKIYNNLSQYFILPYSIMDFVQEGNEALIKLVYNDEYQGYDINMFYLLFYTRFRRNVINHLLPFSPNTVDRYINFINMKDNFSQTAGCDISIEEFGLSSGEAAKRVQNFKNCFIQNQPLNCCFDENEIVDDEISLEEKVCYLITRDIVLEIFDKVGLTDREREIIIKHLGFNLDGHDGIEVKFSDLAPLYGISKQRILQLFNRGIKKFQNDDVVMKKLRLCKENVI